MRYPRYPAYKPSGLEWLGEIPAHWNVLPLKRASTVALSNVDKKTVDGQQPVYLCNYVDVYRNEFITTSMSFMYASASNEQIDRLTLKQGDVIVTKDSESPDDIGVPALVAEDLTDVVCGYHLALIRPIHNVLDGRYLLRFLQGSFARSRFSVEAVGMTRYGLSKSAITDSTILLPPIDEQKAIAAFLDRETAQIDTLVAKQERLIALLQEKRQALISHAVTKGMDLAAPMKESGVAWLGQVPAYWEVKKLSHHIVSLETGWTPNSEQRLAEDDEWAVLKVGCVRSGVFHEDEHKALAAGVVPDETLEVRAGDLLMSRANTLELVGSVGLVKRTRRYLTLSDKTFRLRLAPSLLPEYANYLLQSSASRSQIELAANGASASMKNIGQVSILGLILPVPTIAEQEAILSHLDRELAIIKRLADRAQKMIGGLKERRAALISAAVTGKIDVRNEC